MWVRLAVATGLKRIAVLMAHQGLGRIASEEIIGDTEFVTRTFESLDEAVKWIGGDQKSPR